MLLKVIGPHGLFCNFIGDANTSLLKQTAHENTIRILLGLVMYLHAINFVYGSWIIFDKVPPRLVHSNEIGLSASTSDEIVKEWMNSSDFLVQTVHLENTQNKDSLGKLCTGTEKSFCC